MGLRETVKKHYPWVFGAYIWLAGLYAALFPHPLWVLPSIIIALLVSTILTVWFSRGEKE